MATTEREMQIDVPAEIMHEVCEIIEREDLENSILGVEDPDLICINFIYTEEQRGTIMEILEIVEDHINQED